MTTDYNNCSLLKIICLNLLPQNKTMNYHFCQRLCFAFILHSQNHRPTIIFIIADYELMIFRQLKIFFEGKQLRCFRDKQTQ